METVNFYLDKRRVKKDGTYPIKLNVWNNGQIIIGTQFSSTEENWAGYEFSKKEQNYKAKNMAIRNLINKVERHIIMLEDRGLLKQITNKKLKVQLESIVSGNNNTKKTFVDYIDDFVSCKTNRTTVSMYLYTKNKILEFDPKCTFETMDKKWLSSFENWMAETMKVNAYAIHLRNIRAVFNYAIDEDITTLYPFRKFQIKKEETRKRCLTVEQLRTLREYPCEEYQERYRDMFMLMFYMIGINAVDLLLAKKTDLINGRMEYKRAKTSKLYSIKVEPEAMELIEKYSGKGEYLLNVMNEYKNYKDFLHRMGIALKQIGEIERKGLGGKKVRTPLFPDISSYWSRHTWATIASELEIPKETISEALGHSYGCETTSIYIKFDKRKVDEANRKVIDYLNSTK